MKPLRKLLTPTEALYRILISGAKFPSIAAPRYRCLYDHQPSHRRTLHHTPLRRQITASTAEEDEYTRLQRERQEKLARKNAERAVWKQEKLAAQEAKKRARETAAAVKNDASVPQPPPRVALKYRVPQGDHPPIDEEIQYSLVRVKDRTGQLGAPTRLRDVLRGMNRQRDFLVQVNAGAPEGVMPLCQVLGKERVYEEVRARQQPPASAKDGRREGKVVEVLWGEDKATLALKSGRIKTFLSEGKKVTVELTMRRTKRHLTAEDMERVMEQMRAAALSVDKVKETQKMVGVVGKKAYLTFEVV